MYFVTVYCLLVSKPIKTLLKYSLKDLKPVLNNYLNGIFISNLRATLGKMYLKYINFISIVF